MAGFVDVDAGNWREQVLMSKELVLVEFWHPTCPFCRALEPVFSELADEYKDKVKFAKLNILESLDNKLIALNNGVMGTPTLAFYCDGRSIGSAVGFLPKESLKQLLDEMLARRKNCLEKSTSLVDYI
jgi:thioredoxin-like negative regulator of GroEL